MSNIEEEFLAEAQEIIEGLSRDLLLLDQAQKDGDVHPDLINEIFRGVHTLKGIAGMFGFAKLGALAHSLEDTLDALRLGKITLTQEVLDVLFEGIEGFQRLLSNDPEVGSFDVERFVLSLEELASAPETEGDDLESFDLDASVLAVLTEYEEHRLRSNVAQGVALYRLRVSFSLTTIDSHLEDLKNRAKPMAEIITYLPSPTGGDGDAIDLDVLMASSASYEELHDALVGESQAELVRVARRSAVRVSRPPPPPPAPVLEAPRRTDPPGPADDSIVPAAQVDIVEAESLSQVDGQDPMSLRSVANTVRVDIRKLDHLMNVVGELALVRSAVARLTEKLRGRAELRQLAIDLHRVNRGFERHLEALQEGILDVRMVPLGQVFDKLARVVRQVAREHDKEVHLLVMGAETEVDKLIVEELSDPLMHLIRNAIDHGIESPKVRELAEKPATGTLALNAYQKGNHVVIEVEDDGAGMNDRMLVEAAIRKGLISADASHDMTREEALNLIFLAGFSTRSAITDISGRGVGMDVVKTNISRLGGVIDVQSEQGVGTKFTVTLPVTLAIISALLVRVGGREFAVPISAVREAIILRPADIKTIEGREVLTLRGATLPLCWLARLFRLGSAATERKYVVVCSVGPRRVGFVVDELEGQQDIVIKALGKSLRNVHGFSGATDLGDQRVALVLDVIGLLEEVVKTTEVVAEVSP